MESFLCPLFCILYHVARPKKKKNTDMDVLQVTLSEILEHFNGLKEESVLDLLSSLEGDFLIYKKNNMYRVM